MTEAKRQTLGTVAIMLVGVGSFCLMDAGLKILVAHYPPMQVTALRGLASLPLVLVWIAAGSGFRQIVRVRYPLHLFRGLMSIGMLASFTYGLRVLPLTEAYAIFFTAPLLITALAVPILGERVGWPRWVAILVGLGGVLIVLRPTGSGAVTLAGLAVLATAVGYAVSAITVRVLGRTDSTESMIFWVTAISGVGATLMALPRWVAIRPGDWIAIGGVAVAGTLGQWGITEAFRRGEASFLAPFEYTALAWGTALDLMVWRVVPPPQAFVGAAVIIASGVYLIRRDKRVTAEIELH